MTWSLRVDQRSTLRVLQRKMLRMVLNARLRILPVASSDATSNTDASDHSSITSNLEPWVDFLRRTAHWTDDHLKTAGLSEWTVLWKRRKWQWAAKLLGEGPGKWSVKATLWQPLVHSNIPRGRRQARSKTNGNKISLTTSRGSYQKQGRVGTS